MIAALFIIYRIIVAVLALVVIWDCLLYTSDAADE